MAVLSLKRLPSHPRDVVEDISRHQSEILDLLRSGISIWSAAEWRAFFDERARIAEHDGGFNRLDAEMCAFEDCVDHWSVMHPPLANQHGGCLRCGISVSPKEGSSVTVACSGGAKGRLHPECAPTWRNLRRWDARSALLWLLERSRTAPT